VIFVKKVPDPKTGELTDDEYIGPGWDVVVWADVIVTWTLDVEIRCELPTLPEISSIWS
jgi:hypothetical protein